jgi:hypothetical protein
MKPARRAQLLACISLAAFYVAAQTTASDKNLLTKTRGLYDAPFTGNVVSFDCVVQFDWKKHITDLLGTIPPQGMALAEHLQPIPHRVFVDSSGAFVSAQPKLPDLTGVAHGADMEQVFSTMVSGGLNTWLPFARNIILPVEPTKYHFQKVSTGYELTLKGQDVDALLNLQPDLRLTKGASRLPQALSFKMAFISGPKGYLLQSITTNPDTTSQAIFSYTYQDVSDIQIPLQVTVTPVSHEVWRYSLTDCKVMRGVTVHVGPPK